MILPPRWRITLHAVLRAVFAPRLRCYDATFTPLAMAVAAFDICYATAATMPLIDILRYATPPFASAPYITPCHTLLLRAMRFDVACCLLPLYAPLYMPLHVSARYVTRA